MGEAIDVGGVANARLFSFSVGPSVGPTVA